MDLLTYLLTTGLALLLDPTGRFPSLRTAFPNHGSGPMHHKQFRCCCCVKMHQSIVPIPEKKLRNFGDFLCGFFSPQRTFLWLNAPSILYHSLLATQFANVMPDVTGRGSSQVHILLDTSYIQRRRCNNRSFQALIVIAYSICLLCRSCEFSYVKIVLSYK